MIFYLSIRQLQESFTRYFESHHACADFNTVLTDHQESHRKQFHKDHPDAEDGRSRRLLIHSDDSIEKISEQAGFNSADHFARTFRKHYGISPLKYRKTHQQI